MILESTPTSNLCRPFEQNALWTGVDRQQKWPKWPRSCGLRLAGWAFVLACRWKTSSTISACSKFQWRPRLDEVLGFHFCVWSILSVGILLSISRIWSILGCRCVTNDMSKWLARSLLCWWCKGCWIQWCWSSGAAIKRPELLTYSDGFLHRYVFIFVKSFFLYPWLSSLFFYGFFGNLERFLYLSQKVWLS